MKMTARQVAHFTLMLTRCHRRWPYRHDKFASVIDYRTAVGAKTADLKHRDIMHSALGFLHRRYR